MNGNHGRSVALEDSDFIQTVWISFQYVSGVACQMQHPPGFCQVIAGINLLKSFFHLRRKHIGQEPQAASIDAQYGNFFFSYPACRFQKGTVSADADGHIGFKIISLENLQSGQVGRSVQSQKIVEFVADTDLRIFPTQYFQQVGDVCRLMFLISVPEKSKPECLLHTL